MSRSVGILLIFALVVLEVAVAASLRRLKRNDYTNDDLRAYARPHSGTRIIHGTAQRYAPNEWPKWYVWTLMNWGGHSRLAPSNHGQGGHGGGG
uniref:Secreted protein n=1 Tax=Plectus sambesii TaxID=2011161 RepID=A0A914XE61_9BILA